MSTFREYLVNESDDQFDRAELQRQLAQRSYMNTEKPGGNFNLGRSVAKHGAVAGLDTAADLAADVVPGGNLIKGAAQTAFGVGMDWLNSRASKQAVQTLCQKYRLTPEVFNLDKRVSEMLSPETLKKIESITLSDATLQETLQKKGKIPYDYANQTAMKYVVGAFQNIRGPKP
jgi:hypothetical protein